MDAYTFVPAVHLSISKAQPEARSQHHGGDQPTMELTIMTYNGIQYSGGTGGGTFSKLAVKFPNFETRNNVELSSGV